MQLQDSLWEIFPAGPIPAPRDHAAPERGKDECGPVEGDPVAAFERRLAILTGFEHVVACASVADALEVLLQAFGVRGGGEVIVTAGTSGIDVCRAVLARKANPMPVDVEARSWCIDLDLAELMVNDGTAALVVEPLHGGAPDLRRARTLANHAGIPLLGVLTQIGGSAFDGVWPGEELDAVVLPHGDDSALPTGAGGSIATRDTALAERIRALVDPATALGVRGIRGGDRRMPSTFASIGCAQAERVAGHWRLRNEVWPRLDAVMRDWGWEPQEHLPAGPQCGHAAVLVDTRLDGVPAEVQRAALTFLTRADFAAPAPGPWDRFAAWLPPLCGRLGGNAARAASDAVRTPHPEWDRLHHGGGVWPGRLLLDPDSPDLIDAAFLRMADAVDELRALADH